MIIKTCGLRSPDNIRAVSQLAIDWIGFIFYPKSQRFVGEDKDLLFFLKSAEGAEMPQKRVGVFVNETHDKLVQAINDYQLDYVQLHGAEGPMYCEAIQKHIGIHTDKKPKLIRAFRVSSSFDFGITTDYYPYCSHFVFDAKGQLPGGNGHQYDWNILNRYTGETPFLLSGGIGPADVEGVRQLNHSALVGIDINSKFETKPALKDVELLSMFIQRTRQF